MPRDSHRSCYSSRPLFPYPLGHQEAGRVLPTPTGGRYHRIYDPTSSNPRRGFDYAAHRLGSEVSAQRLDALKDIEIEFDCDKPCVYVYHGGKWVRQVGRGVIPVDVYCCIAKGDGDMRFCCSHARDKILPSMHVWVLGRHMYIYIDSSTAVVAHAQPCCIVCQSHKTTQIDKTLFVRHYSSLLADPRLERRLLDVPVRKQKNKRNCRTTAVRSFKYHMI